MQYNIKLKTIRAHINTALYSMSSVKWLLMDVQMLVGFWLVACLIFTTGFKSSLIAHLTVQGKAQAIKSLEDLIAQPSWEWGTEAWLLKGIPLEYFSKHTDPVVMEVYRRTEVGCLQHLS